MKKLMPILCAMVFFVLVVYGTGNAYPVDGLVAYYALDGSANDVSGNGNHGELYNGTFIDDPERGLSLYNDDFNYDNPNSWVKTPLSGIFDESTISFWFYPIAPDGGNTEHWYGADLLSIHKDFDNSGSFHIRYGEYGDSKFHVSTINNWNPGDLHASSTSPINNWYNVTLVNDNESHLLYVNGVLEDSFTGNIITDTYQLHIGTCLNTLPPEYYAGGNYVGAFDDVLIYDKALTNTEVMDVYNSLNPVPEPTTILLFGTGLIGLAGARRNFKRN